MRLLAWSTVAQAGWVVLPLSALDDDSAAASGGYLLAYVVATLVAFTRGARGHGTPRRGVVDQGRTLAAYTGLLRAHPLLGGALGLALLSLAGLPPGVIGLVAKVVALRPVVGAGQWLLVAVAVLNAVIGVAVYLRWFAVLLPGPRRGTGPRRHPPHPPVGARPRSSSAGPPSWPPA